MANWNIEVLNKEFLAQGQLVNVHESKLDVALSKARLFSFRIRLDNSLASYIAIQSSKEPIYFRVYRNKQLVFYGPLMTAQEAGDENQNATIQITAAGPEIIWAQRLCGRTPEGIKYIGPGEGYTAAEVFKLLLEESNSRKEMHINFTSGPIQSSVHLNYESPPFKYLSEVLTDLYNQDGGFDWIVYPQELSSSKIGRLVVKDTINEERPSALFEWGFGRSNLATFGRVVDLTNMINVAWNIGPAGPEATGQPTVVESDATQNAQWGLRESLIPASILNTELRIKLAKEALTVRKFPRQVLTIQPVNDDGKGRVPVFGTDYNIGDSVRVRIVYEDAVHLDAMVRVWGITFNVDENKKETQALTISNS